METGNIDHEQIKIDDAKKACIKVGGVIGRNSCNWTLDVIIDGEVCTNLELCYHCQSEKEFTPEKAFDLFDYGTSVFVLCNTKKDGSIERKVIGLVPVDDNPYPKLCGLKRFFAKVQQIGSDGYPLWDIEGPFDAVPVCKYYWIFFDEDGSVRAEEVKNASFIDPDDVAMTLLDSEISLFRQFTNGSLSLMGLATALSDLTDKYASATDVLDRVTDIPKGSDSVFTKAFMMHVGECDQRYVAEQHLLMKDRQIKFDHGASFPITNCTYVPYSPPNRFYCNVNTGDMVWYHIIQEDCPIFLGLTLHVNLTDGLMGYLHPFDLNGYIDYFNPPYSEAEDVDGYQEVQIGITNISDLPSDLIPEITNIDGTVISGYRFYLGRPMKFTFDVVTAESHWEGGKDSQDAEHVVWTEEGFGTVTSWKFEQTINPIELGYHENTSHDDGEYGPVNDANGDAFSSIFCNQYKGTDPSLLDQCTAKCRHCGSASRDLLEHWTQGDNGESHVTFEALSTSGSEDNFWNEMTDEMASHAATVFVCCPQWEDGFYWCSAGSGTPCSETWTIGGLRYGHRTYNSRRSNSYKVAWVSPNVTYIEKQISRTYDSRQLQFNALHAAYTCTDSRDRSHCGGPEVGDFNRWTDLDECLYCVQGVPDFTMPFLDFPGWPSWPDGYTQNIFYVDGTYGWELDRNVNINNLNNPYIRKFDMGDGITFDCSIYEIPYYLDDRATTPSAGLVVAAKGYQDYSNAAGSSNWKIYHDNVDVTDKVLDALNCDPAVLVTLGMV